MARRAHSYVINAAEAADLGMKIGRPSDYEHWELACDVCEAVQHAQQTKLSVVKESEIDELNPYK